MSKIKFQDGHNLGPGKALRENGIQHEISKRIWNPHEDNEWNFGDA